jgi:hypothetical protein
MFADQSPDSPDSPYSPESPQSPEMLQIEEEYRIDEDIEQETVPQYRQNLFMAAESGFLNLIQINSEERQKS